MKALEYIHQSYNIEFLIKFKPFLNFWIPEKLAISQITKISFVPSVNLIREGAIIVRLISHRHMLLSIGIFAFCGEPIPMNSSRQSGK